MLCGLTHPVSPGMARDGEDEGEGGWVEFAKSLVFYPHLSPKFYMSTPVYIPLIPPNSSEIPKTPPGISHKNSPEIFLVNSS